MKRILIIWAAVMLLLAPGRLGAQESAQLRLSDSAYASILTCGAGEEFYTSFGHTAIRVYDPAIHLDLVYNYGTFDFDTPHFYWTFTLGKLNYCLSRTSFDAFMFEYRTEGRAVWEQRLRLTNQEVNNLFVMLETNYLPEYRYYKYDFFRDNCATRVRDMVRDCLCHRSLSPECTADTNRSYRNILYRSTERTLLWWRLGIDMALGVRCDQRCSNYEYMFSPLEMMGQFDTMTVSDTRQPLAEPATVLLSETHTPLARSVSHAAGVAEGLEPALVRPHALLHRCHFQLDGVVPVVLHRPLLYQGESECAVGIAAVCSFRHQAAEEQPGGRLHPAGHAFCRHGDDPGSLAPTAECRPVPHLADTGATPDFEHTEEN